MIHLKRFNESGQSDIDFHKDQIKDLFQDIIDEYGIDEHTDLGEGEDGMYYMLENMLDIGEDKGYQILIPKWNKGIKTTQQGHIIFVICINFDKLSRDGNGYQYNGIITPTESYKKFISLRKDLMSLDGRLKTIYKFNKRCRSGLQEYLYDTEYHGERWIVIEYDFEINI